MPDPHCGRCGTTRAVTPHQIVPVGGRGAEDRPVLQLCDLCRAALEDAAAGKALQVRIARERPPGRSDGRRP